MPVVGVGRDLRCPGSDNGIDARAAMRAGSHDVVRIAMSNDRKSLDVRVPLIALAMAVVSATAAHAQQPQPPKFTVSLEAGAQLPSSLYDKHFDAVVPTDSTPLSVRTLYQERIDVLPLGRLVLRYRPESDFGGYLGVQYGRAGTTAEFHGGLHVPETVERSVGIFAVDFGVSVVIGRWSGGRGFVEYTFGPTYMRHTLDLSGGHRKALAVEVFDVPDDRVRWSSRKWSSWGFGVGATVRFPVGDALALRTGFQTHIVSVAATKLAFQEREDLRRLSGRHSVISYENFTAHYPAVRVGLEYVLNRQRPRPAPMVAVPRGPRATDEPSATTRDALALLAQGDTAVAIDRLRERVEVDPQDGSALRELALLLAARAELGPAQREEAWQALQRAIRVNPGDDALLSAYGRVRGLIQRAGQVQRQRPPLALSAINAQADAAGVLSLAWVIQNLSDSGGAARYRVTVEVTDSQGAIVPLRAADSGEPPRDVFELERTADSQPVDLRLELRLARAQPGPHSVRVQVTDLGSGQTVNGVAGFEIR